jgi:elongator complex protein 3
LGILAATDEMADSMIRCCADIVKSLSLAHDEGNDVSLNTVRAKSAKKFKLKQMPRLVDIIAAVPPELADALIPKLKAKPVRTASGVRSTAQSFLRLKCHGRLQWLPSCPNPTDAHTLP